MPYPSVGQELLNVPFPEMVQKLALAIAEGQVALDMHSIEVAKALSETKLEAGTVPIMIKETVDEDGNVTNVDVVYNENDMPLIVYGIQPTFYQFTDTIIEVKMAITMAIERETEKKLGVKFKFETTTEAEASYKSSGIAAFLFGRASAKVKNTTTIALTTTYNARYSQKYSFKEEGTSLLRTNLKPVPPPERAIPKVQVEESGGTP